MAQKYAVIDIWKVQRAEELKAAKLDRKKIAAKVARVSGKPPGLAEFVCELEL